MKLNTFGLLPGLASAVAFVANLMLVAIMFAACAGAKAEGPEENGTGDILRMSVAPITEPKGQ